MRCPFCNYEDTKVVDSRPSEEKKRRRRECVMCGKRFTTYEVVEKPLLMVYKRDGSFEPFDKVKLLKGIQTAIKKRPVSVEDVMTLVDDIEKLDHVAYVRFASVYKDFNDVESFVKIISELND